MVDLVSTLSTGSAVQNSAQSLVPERKPVENQTEIVVSPDKPLSESVSARKQRVAVPISDLGISTYRDQESGRVIIRVFDRRSGDVLVELPPETQRSAFSVPEPPPPIGTNAKIDV